MANTESRTTKRARALVPAVRVSVAVPAELLADENEPTKSWRHGWKAMLTSSIGPTADPDARVLAFTSNGTLVMTTKKSNGAIPEEVSAQTESFPEVLDDSGQELVIQLDDDTYRIGAIYRETAWSAIERAGQVDEEITDVETETEELVESEPVVADYDEVESEPVVADCDGVESEPVAAAEPVASEPEPRTNPGVVATAAAATSNLSAAEIAASLKRNFLTDEFGEIEIETRSRPTMQCQRLLRDRYVYLAVPGKAQPREGTDDPKGRFVLAFTDQGVTLFKPSRGNEALPRDVIGAIDGTPIDFEQADYNAKEGGFLTVGARRYVITRPYVKSVVSYIAEHHGGPPPLP